LLTLLRGLILLKRHGGPALQRIAAPAKSVGLFFVTFIGVPSYRLLFFFRRTFFRVALPAKHRIIYLISNKYAVHALVIIITMSVTFVNLGARDVRAETFGQQSILYGLVSEDDLGTMVVVEAGTSVTNLGARSSYYADTVVDARLHIDTDYISESFVTSETGEIQVDTTADVPTRDGIETYTVQEGDTLGQIAEQFGLKTTTILWANSLTFTSTIRPGNELSILPSDGVLYTVRSGDTLSTIASKYDVDIDEIKSQNNISGSVLSIGKELLLAGGEPPTPTTTSRATSSVAELWTAPSSSSASPAVGGWVWPTDWRVITQYYGWRHTGLDIDGDYSTNNYASRAGTVIYSGWRSGYGITVEIDHGDGFMTRYAHNAQNYVSTGEYVYAGQAIAQLGTTGRSTGTHIHFEIIKNGKFQNPLDYIR
jgi:murein DD-endopeptidase MepM/ murein hydrolase activator NlpD